MLGSGATGEVNLYFSKADKAQYAVKKVWVKSADVEAATRHETDLLRRLNHPAIVRYHGYHQERVGDTLFGYIGVCGCVASVAGPVHIVSVVKRVAVAWGQQAAYLRKYMWNGILMYSSFWVLPPPP
jgi:hypothetical protein